MSLARRAVERLIEAHDQHDPGAVVSIYAPTARISRPGAPELTPAAYAGYYGGFVQAMPDFRHEVVSVVEDGSSAAFESIVVGTFTGSLPTPNGPIPGNGASIRFQHAQFLRVDADGLISEDRDYADMGEIMAQFSMAAGSR